ncbi:MAG: hypothetical protein K2O24_09100 [Muribaculaceae bacterium]|nr:hypothetical protein [Muribaculaceae bacterium]
MSTPKYILSALSAIILPAAAAAQDSAPVVEYLYNNAHAAYFQVDPPADELEELTLDIYDNVRSFTKILSIDILNTDLEQYAVSGLENVYAFPVNTGDRDVVVNQLKYKYPDQPRVVGRLKDGDDPFIYMTDIPGCNPLPNANYGVGWGNRYYNTSYNNNGPLQTVKSTYAKGYGAHGGGWVETPASVDLSKYSRFCVELGGQPISNPTRGKLGYQLYNGEPQAFLNSGNVAWQNVVEWDFPLVHTEAGKTLKVVFSDGGDGNTNDVVCIGAPRFYYNESESDNRKQPQTITFDTPGCTIFEDNPEVTLSAYSSGGTKIFYAIVSGNELATLEGNVLRPVDGCNGEVVVEAMTFGDKNNEAASATQTYTFRFGPVVEYLYTHKSGGDNTSQTLYVYADSKGKTLEKLRVDIYDDVRSFTQLKSVDLAAEGLSAYAVPNMKNVYAVPFENPGGGTAVHRLTYKYSGEDEVVGHLFDGREPFIYMTDIPGCNPLPNANYGVGWGSRFYNTSYDNNGPLRTSKYTYAKGYGAHGGGHVETPSTVDLTPYTRFCVDVGGQVISNPTRGRLNFALYNGISQPYLNTGNVNWDNVYEWDFPLQNTSTGKTVKVVFGVGGDGNTNDIVCVGAPRFYYSYDTRLPQTMEWVDEEIINNYRPFTMPLAATASSGLPVIYNVVQGGEYARVDSNGALTFYNIPSEGEVVVEAYQPGSKDYEPSDITRCSFHIRRALVIRADERLDIQGGHDIDELVVYANANSAGQAVVKDGVVNVKKLTLRYTFVPGEWNHISFPSDLDLNLVSNLAAKGFRPATEEGQSGTYLLCEYDGRVRAENPGESPWVNVTSGRVTGMKGYIMKLENDNPDPVEITFEIDNVALCFDNTIRALNLQVDMSGCEPETRHVVYIRPANVKGNTLRVDMRYVPPTREDMPLNHARALEAMRVTRTPDGKAIRLTLPEQTPAKVAFFDRKGKKLLKTVSYISPMKIDVSDLKHGTYRMVVIYGPASTEQTLEL